MFYDTGSTETSGNYLIHVQALSTFCIKGCWDESHIIQSRQALEQERMATKLIIVASVLLCQMAAAKNLVKFKLILRPMSQWNITLLNM